MKFLKHSLITFLSLMVFVTSSGLTVNLYCVKEFQKVSIKEEISECFIQHTKVKPCEKILSSTKIKQLNACCKNQKIQAKSQTKITANKTKKDSFFTRSITFLNSYFGSIFPFNNSDKDEEKEKEATLFPLLKKGLYILLQQFRN